MTLELQPLFPLALAQVQLRLDPLELAVMLQEVLALRGSAEGNPNPGCAWTGDINGVWQLHRLPAFAGVCEQLRRHSWGYLEALGFAREGLALHIQRAWPVVSAPGQAVGRHHHPNAHLSAILYLNGDGSGRSGCLRLFPPRAINELVPGLAVGHGGPLCPERPAAARWNAPWFDLAPRAGLLVLFPAGTDHAVTPNDDPEELRLSLAFDLVLSTPPAGR
ncbi:MAG: hypothetical protein EB136_07135, partial [Synechococcaceae bacterium WBB_3_034]|nr:hypothetical protein [Synechococcaceae bacterium WBB_3_034]